MSRVILYTLILLAIVTFTWCTLGTEQLLTTDYRDIEKLGLHPNKIVKCDTLNDQDGQKVYRFYYKR